IYRSVAGAVSRARLSPDPVRCNAPVSAGARLPAAGLRDPAAGGRKAGRARGAARGCLLWSSDPRDPVLLAAAAADLPVHSAPQGSVPDLFPGTCNPGVLRGPARGGSLDDP